MEANWISKQEHDFLICEHPRTPTLSMLPKIHKSLDKPPGRPIISANGSLTEPVSQFIDCFIKPLAQQLPSYIQDTTHVLNITSSLKIPEDCFLVSFDVESLYSIIDHQDGLRALNHFLRLRPNDSLPPTELILELTEWTLTNNVFLFRDELFMQTRGTAMGACFAPNYANLFLGLWESEYVYNNPLRDKILWWGRYIDDILLFWTGTLEELKQFHEHLNDNNINVKLSLQFSQSSINFLDLTITKEAGGHLDTTIYRKPTDKNTVLKADSFHPHQLKKNIPFGQYQRIRRICNKDEEFEEQARTMTTRFVQRGYEKDVLHDA